MRELKAVEMTRLLGPASVEFKVKAVFDDRLVAAPGEGHLQGEGGVLEQLGKGVGVLPQTQG